MPESGTTGIERPGQGSALMRSNLVVAAGTTLSRLTGLLRVMVLAAVIGKQALTDVYLIGNETPNIVYELLLGGVLSATFVPMFTGFLTRRRPGGGRGGDERRHHRDARRPRRADVRRVPRRAGDLRRSTRSTTEAGVDAELLRRVGTLLTRVFLIQIFFYGATGLANAYLNAKRRFFAAAWSPILANVIVIVTLLSLPDAPRRVRVAARRRPRRTTGCDWTLGLGTTAGIAAMALVLVPAVREAGLDFRPSFNLRHPAISSCSTMSMWTLGYVVGQPGRRRRHPQPVEPGSGDSTAYFQAFTFFVLPHGLLAMSIATTFVPEMARAVGAQGPIGVQRASIARASA